MRIPALQSNTLAIGFLLAIVAFALGIYVGFGFAQRQESQREINDAVLRTALNLEVIRAIRDGKTAEAIGLMGSMNEVNLAYLMHYEKDEPKNEDFARKKKLILSKLEAERSSRPNRAPDTSNSEQQRFERDVARYFERNR